MKMLKTVWFLILFQTKCFCKPFENISEQLLSTELDFTKVELNVSQYFHFDQMNYNEALVEYVIKMLCNKNVDYRFYHILVDRSLHTKIADELLKRLGTCISGGILTTE